MNEKSHEPEGIGLEYDPNRHVLRIILVLPDGETRTISQTRDEALMLHRSLGKMLGIHSDN